MAVEMKIKGLMWDPVSRMPIVVLKTQKGDDLLPIFVGLFEANAIAQQLEHSVSPRPMTHDLLGNLIEALRAKVNPSSSRISRTTRSSRSSTSSGTESPSPSTPGRAMPWPWPSA
jgi:hypothetical protein